MALQVWLPLTQDLRNQGLANSANFGTSTSFATTGKIGSKSAYSNMQKTATFSELNNVTNFSITYWIKIDSSIAIVNWTKIIGLECIAGNDTTTIRDEFTNAVGEHQIIIGKDSTVGSNSYTYYGPGNTLDNAKDKWTHHAIVKNNNNTYIYTNGVLTNTLINSNFENSPQKLTGKIYLGNSTSAAAQINDVRVYDHCLTPEEVKKIAQGLVLHYPLNRQGWGQENLVWNSNWNTHSTTPPEGWVNWGSPPTREIVTIDGKNWLHVISDTTQFQGYSQNWTKRNGVGELTANTKMTVSFTAKLATAASIAPIGIHWCNSSGTIVTQNWTTTALTTSPKRYSFTYTTPADCVAFNIMVGDNTNTAHEVWVTDIKLEFGEIATPWCPNSSDELAIRAGVSEAIEYDISGFKNNGIKVADGNNLFKGTTFSSFDRSNFVVNSSTDWTAYLRYYNGNAANHSFSDGIDTVTLNAVSNLGVAFVRKATDINLDSSSYYTISCEAMSTQTTKPLCIGLSYYNTSNAWVWRGGTNGTNFTAANTWQKFSFTFTPDADTQYICYCFTVVGTSGGTDTFKIRNCKLEKGSVATDWTPGVIQKYTSDTPKYQVSTEFNGTEMIEVPWNPSGTSSFTVTGWFYHNSGTTYYAAKNTYNTYICLEDGRFFIYPATGSAYVGYWTNTTNVWQHVVLVHDAIEAKLKLYVNGLFVDEVVTDGTVYNSDILDIGGRQGTAQYNGNISDFRIYATALSAEDILELYQNNSLSNS